MSKITFETPKYKVKVKMESDECFCGITAFYEFLAKQLGFGENVYAENTLFDCKAVEVSKSVFENIRSYYEAEYLDKFKKEDGFAESFGILWIWYGPKATLPDEGYVAVVNTHKFITGKVAK